MAGLIIPLPNGGTLRCDEGEEYAYGSAVRICDQKGNEILMWTAEEWRDDPEQVMGAIFMASLDSIQELTKNRVLRDGAWVADT